MLNHSLVKSFEETKWCFSQGWCSGAYHPRKVALTATVLGKLCNLAKGLA